MVFQFRLIIGNHIGRAAVQFPGGFVIVVMRQVCRNDQQRIVSFDQRLQSLRQKPRIDLSVNDRNNLKFFQNFLQKRQLHFQTVFFLVGMIINFKSRQSGKLRGQLPVNRNGSQRGGKEIGRRERRSPKSNTVRRPEQNNVFDFGGIFLQTAVSFSRR